MCASFEEDGSPKVRPIDDLSASGRSSLPFLGNVVENEFAGVNGCTIASEKLTNDRLDLLVESMRRIKSSMKAG